MPSLNPSRRYFRVRADMRVRLSFIDSNGTHQSVVARTVDISLGGLSVHAPVELPFDTDIIVEFTFPGDSVPIYVGALVRNRRGFRYGTEFQPMSRAEKLRLKSFLTRLQVERSEEAKPVTSPVGRIDRKYDHS